METATVVGRDGGGGGTTLTLYTHIHYSQFRSSLYKDDSALFSRGSSMRSVILKANGKKETAMGNMGNVAKPMSSLQIFTVPS
jgi:hypothetical protein